MKEKLVPEKLKKWGNLQNFRKNATDFVSVNLMSPKRIFSSIFQLSTFFSTHLTLKAFLITWGRLHEWMVEWLRIHPSFRSSVVRSSKVVTVLIHSVQHLSSAVEELSPILMMAAIKSCWSCSSRGLPV